MKLGLKGSVHSKNNLLKKLEVSNTSKLLTYMKALKHKEIILQIRRWQKIIKLTEEIHNLERTITVFFLINETKT